MSMYSMSISSRDGFEEALQAMQRSCSDNGAVPTLASFQRLSTAVDVKQQWNETAAEQLVSYMNDVLVHSNNEHIEMEALRLLDKVLEKWPDHLMYSVITSNNQCLIDSIFHLLLESTNSTIQRDTVMTAKWWQVRERIQWYTSFDGSILDKSTIWVEQRERLEKVALIAMNILLSNEMDHDSQDVLPSTNDRERRMACAFLLSTLLKQNVSGWLFSSSEQAGSSAAVSELSKLLLSESVGLNDNNMGAYSSRFSLACLELLCWIQKRHHQPIPDLESLIRSTPVVENVVRVAFPTELSTPRGPRWTYETCDYSLRESARDVVRVWRLAGQAEALSAFGATERLWRTFAEETWNCIMSGTRNDTRLQQALPGLLLLHTALCKATTSDILSSMLTPNGLDGPCDQERTYQRLLTSLASLFHHENFAIAASSAALFKTLLCDRINLQTKDQVSRTIWGTVENMDDHSILEICMDAVVKFSMGGACESLLLCILNVVQVLLTSQKCCQRMLLRSSTDKLQQTVDLLAKLISPGNKPRSYQQVTEPSAMRDEETPKMGNLETTKKFFGSSTKEKDGPGIKIAICVSAATALARLGWSPLVLTSDDHSLEQTRSLQTNIQHAVNEFVLELPSFVDATPSQDLTRRMLCLNSFLSSSSAEGEELVASSLYATEVNRARTFLQHTEEVSEYRRHLQLTTAKIEQLKNERDSCKAEMTASGVIHEREISRIRLQASADAARMVELHTTERSKAEDRASECANRMAQAEARQKEAEKAAEVARACEDLIRSELCGAAEKVKELEHDLQMERNKVEESESRTVQAARELGDTKEQLNTMNEALKAKACELDAIKATALESQKAAADLEVDLENTYSTLVALAHAYQEKEKEMKTIEATHNKRASKAKTKLEAEQNRNEILVESEQRLQRENERLLRKLARAKEKLDEERRDRREELERRKRHGPVSYINQLHDESMASEKSAGRSRYASSLGKENSSSSTRTRRLYR